MQETDKSLLFHLRVNYRSHMRQARAQVETKYEKEQKLIPQDIQKQHRSPLR